MPRACVERCPLFIIFECSHDAVLKMYRSEFRFRNRPFSTSVGKTWCHFHVNGRSIRHIFTVFKLCQRRVNTRLILDVDFKGKKMIPMYFPEVGGLIWAISITCKGNTHESIPGLYQARQHFGWPQASPSWLLQVPVVQEVRDREKSDVKFSVVQFRWLV